ncbi:aminomethyltransferase beta-barrel domain-containing protein [Streptomyces sp. ID05-04B]|uniref:aminomethyltransferase beta-barrel domain-containing protein n=1 Tax=Streptomyces sp. P3 TaxID=2135430 RepID=UPI0029CA6951|nr:aminomethyltransferase beta-barrel domain-containing protein [Streptomyces sp. ID05-04B]
MNGISRRRSRDCGAAPSPRRRTSRSRRPASRRSGRKAARKRSSTRTTPANLDGFLKATFAEPVRGDAPGQAIVPYEGTRPVGSARIAAKAMTVRRSCCTTVTGNGRIR